MEHPPKALDPEGLKRIERENARAEAFDIKVHGHVISQFIEEFSELGVPSKMVDQIEDEFGTYSETDKRSILAIPAALRPRLFAKYAEQLLDGSITPRGILDTILASARKHGFTIGFHLSQSDIKQDKDGEWIVQGREKDHRHGDGTMAYYSTDYRNRYLKKPSSFLYVVRAETNEDSGHYRDTDDSWGHAPTLSIIDKLDMIALERDLDEKMRAATAFKDK